MNWKYNRILNKEYLKNEYIRKGLRQKIIANNVGCTYPTVTSYLKYYKIEEMRIRYVRYLFNIGLRQSEIARKVCRDQAAVSRLLEKTGVDCKSQKWDRVKDTLNTKYGVDNAQKIDYVRRKSIDTCLKKYGVETPLIYHNAHITGVWKEKEKETLSKTKKSSFSGKEYKLPSGKIINIQGYENFALDILLEIYNEDEIETENVPVIEYYKDKKRNYYPDIFIPKENLLIEVKSTYTMNVTKNLYEKMIASKNAGYEYKIWIIDKGKLIEEVD